MRRYLAGLSVAVVAGAVTTSVRADADGLTDPFGPREVALGEAMRAGAIGATSTTLNPAGLSLNRELVFEGSYGYRPGDSASLVGLSACDSTNPLPGCFYYRYAGMSPDVGGMEVSRRTHVGGVTLARAISSRFNVGVGVKYFHFASDEAMGADDASGFNWDLGVTARLTDVVNVAAVGYNLLGKESSEFPRAAGAGVLVRPTSPLAISFDALWDLDRDGATGRYGGGGEYFISTKDGKVGYPIRAGVVHDVATGTYVTGGLGLSSVKLAFDVGARYQVRDGDELLVVASLRVFGPRL